MAPFSSTLSSRVRSAGDEPVGIVIADGGPRLVPSRFAAWVWGPVPDDVAAVATAATSDAAAPEPLVAH